MHEKVTTAQQLLVDRGVKPFQIDALLRGVRSKDRVAPNASPDTFARYYAPPWQRHDTTRHDNELLGVTAAEHTSSNWQ
jgi:hypothetical protein